MSQIICPCCKAKFVLARDIVIEGGEQLASVMRAEHVVCYAAAKGGFYLSRGRGRVAPGAITDALAKGLIVPKWDDKPHLEYWKHK